MSRRFIHGGDARAQVASHSPCRNQPEGPEDHRVCRGVPPAWVSGVRRSDPGPTSKQSDSRCEQGVRRACPDRGPSRHGMWPPRLLLVVFAHWLLFAFNVSCVHVRGAARRGGHSERTWRASQGARPSLRGPLRARQSACDACRGVDTAAAHRPTPPSAPPVRPVPAFRAPLLRGVPRCFLPAPGASPSASPPKD